MGKDRPTRPRPATGPLKATGDRGRALLDLLHRHEMLDALYDGLLVAHPDGTFEALNDMAARVLGGEAPDGQSPMAARPLEMRLVDEKGDPVPDADRPSQRALVRGETVRDALLGLLPAAGQWPKDCVWLRVSAFPMREGLDGQERAALLSFVEVTPEVEARREAQRRRARLQQILDALDDLVLDVGLDGVFRKAPQSHHPGTREYLLPPDVFLGRHHRDVLPERFSRFIDDSLEALRAGECAEPVEYGIDWPDGRHSIYLSKATYLPGTDQDSPGALFVIRDITARRQAEERLQRSEARFRTLFEQHHAIMLQIEPTGGRIVDANEAAARFYGYSRETLRAMRIDDLNTLPADRIREERLAALAEQRNHFIFPHRLATGEVRVVEVHSSPVQLDDGPVLFSIINDVTDRQAAERRLRQSAAVFESTTEAVVIADSEMRIIAVNRAFTEITGFAEHTILGRSLGVTQCIRSHGGRFDDIRRALQDTGRWQGESAGVRADGSAYPQWLTASVVRSPDGRLGSYVLVFSDISSLKEVQRRLEHQAHHDDLTGLPNRVLLRARLEQALHAATRRRTEVAVLFLDMDRFKVVNDSLGHATGDHLLCAVAGRLREVVPEEQILARVGGDEFVVILETAPGREELAEAARHILRSMEQPFELPDGEEIFVGVSIGITRFPGDGVSADELIRNADAALYAAKDAGRGAFHFYRESLTRQASARLNLDREMRRALRDNQFSLAFQPIVSASRSTIEGMEALLRWDHASGRFVSPEQFIPLAEDTGLIRALGEWVLRTALRTMRGWLDDGIAPRTVSVNVSACQLMGTQFAQIVRSALAESGVPPERLELELTEGTLFGDTERMLHLLDDLTGLGVRVAVDDFGTGYSSLAYLQRFPIHRLKVDRSFIARLPEHEQDLAIARAIIQLGRTLGLEVLAEGVEQDQQLALITEAGCDLWQGFLCSPALAPERASQLLRAASRGVTPMDWSPGKP